MICIPYVRCEVDCGGGRRAMSPSASYCLHKKSDEPILSRHTQNMVALLIDLFLKRIEQRFWQTLLQGHGIFSWRLTCLFQFVCIAVLRLDIAFQSCVFLWFLASAYTRCSSCFDRIYTDLCVHQPLQNAWEKHQEVWFHDTICKFWSAWETPFRSRWSLT